VLEQQNYERSRVELSALHPVVGQHRRRTRQLAKDFDMKWDQHLGIEDEAYDREEEEISDVESRSKPYRPNRPRRPVHPNGNYRPLRASPLLGWVPVRVPRKRRQYESRAPWAEQGVGGDLLKAMVRLAGVSNDLENGVVKRIDVLLQRVRIP